MKRVLSILLISFLIYGCTDEPDMNTYNVSILNTSTENLSIEAYIDGAIVSSINLGNNESGLECSYSDENFVGYKLTQCQIDSIIFRFDNNKSYISNINNPTNIDFPNDTNPFGFSSKFVNNNNTFEFIIIQEDFDNAFDLP